MNPRNAMPHGRYESRKKISHKYRGLISRNPVLVGGLLLAPAVVAAFSLKNAVALSLTLILVTLPTLIVASLVRRRVPAWLRIPIYSVTAAFMLIPAHFVVSPIDPTIFDSMGMYFSLMAFNSILYLRAEQFANRNPIGSALLDGLSYCGGFALAICLIAALRELLAYNTLWGISVGLPFRITPVELPFAGFLIIGMMAAMGRYFRATFGRLSRRAQQRALQRRTQLALPTAPRRDSTEAGPAQQGSEGGAPA